MSKCTMTICDGDTIRHCSRDAIEDGRCKQHSDHKMYCPYCDEYSVDEIPKGLGGRSNLCAECEEYSIPIEADE